MRRSVKRVAVALLSLVGCTAGAAAENIRPDDPTYAGAVGTELAFGERPKVLVVDWEAESRVDLEVAMKRGVAVMALDARGPRVLDCQLPGDYTFLGTTRKEKVLRLLNRDEVKANLPLRGVGLASTLEGEFSRGATLDVALVMVGKRTAAPRMANRSQLRGDCSEATHIVRAATVGAFAMSTGTQASLRSAAELFGAEAGASSQSERLVRSTEGDLSACMSADPSADTPPAQCGAALRLDLAPVVDDGAQPSVEETLLASACPAGTELRGDKCEPTSGGSKQCALNDAAQCQAQCDEGSPRGCYFHAWQNERGVGVPIDAAEARGLYVKACELGLDESCRAVAFFQARGIGGPKELETALSYYKAACMDGNAGTCSDLGVFYAHGDGVPKDLELALALYDRACNGGDARGCSNLGEAYLLGDGVPANPNAAVALFERACVAEHPGGCKNLARAYDDGTGVAQDHATALGLLERACTYGGMLACVDAGVRHDRAMHTPRDSKRAVSLYTRACEANEVRGCANLGLMHLEGRGTAKDERRAAELFQRTCAESRLGCDTLGEMYFKGMGVTKDITTAQGILDEACSAGDQRSCAMKRTLGI